MRVAKGPPGQHIHRPTEGILVGSHVQLLYHPCSIRAISFGAHQTPSVGLRPLPKVCRQLWPIPAGMDRPSTGGCRNWSSVVRGLRCGGSVSKVDRSAADFVFLVRASLHHERFTGLPAASCGRFRHRRGTPLCGRASKAVQKVRPHCCGKAPGAPVPPNIARSCNASRSGSVERAWSRIGKLCANLAFIAQ